MNHEPADDDPLDLQTLMVGQDLDLTNIHQSSQLDLHHITRNPWVHCLLHQFAHKIQPRGPAACPIDTLCRATFPIWTSRSRLRLEKKPQYKRTRSLLLYSPSYPFSTKEFKGGKKKEKEKLIWKLRFRVLMN